MKCTVCGSEFDDAVGACPSCALSSSKSSEAVTEDNKVSETPSGLGADFVPAGFWLRVGAFIVDSAVINLILLIFFWFLRVLSGAIVSPKAQILLFLLGIAVWLLSFLWIVVYGVIFESSQLGATPGKLLYGLIVANKVTRTQLTIPQAFLRRIGIFISALTFGFGFIMAGFTAEKQALHDIIAKAIVLKDSKLSLGRLVAAIFTTVIAFFANLVLPSSGGKSDIGQNISQEVLRADSSRPLATLAVVMPSPEVTATPGEPPDPTPVEVEIGAEVVQLAPISATFNDLTHIVKVSFVRVGDAEGSEPTVVLTIDFDRFSPQLNSNSLSSYTVSFLTTPKTGRLSKPVEFTRAPGWDRKQETSALGSDIRIGHEIVGAFIGSGRAWNGVTHDDYRWSLPFRLNLEDSNAKTAH